jgi:hypothetical protein
MTGRDIQARGKQIESETADTGLLAEKNGLHRDRCNRAVANERVTCDKHILLWRLFQPSCTYPAIGKSSKSFREASTSIYYFSSAPTPILLY